MKFLLCLSLTQHTTAAVVTVVQLSIALTSFSRHSSLAGLMIAVVAQRNIVCPERKGSPALLELVRGLELPAGFVFFDF